MKQRSLYLYMLLLAVFFIHGSTALAQSDPLQQAKMYADTKNYDKALEIFRKLYEQTPGDADVYSNYLGALLATKSYKEAERIVQDQQHIHQMNPLLFIDLGRVYEASGKDKKAEEQYEKAIQYLNGDDLLTTQMATAFAGIAGDKYTIRTFERAQDLLHNPFVYGNQLARLYARNGDMDKAINALLNAAPAQMGGIEDVKSTLLELLGNDAQKQVTTQKALVKRINAQPDNTYYAELLTWLFTQKGDWDGALIQIEAIDERNKETGQRLLNFAGEALKQSQYDVAEKALKAVIDKGKEQPLFTVANATLLDVRLQRIQEAAQAKQEDIQQLEKDYEAFLLNFPQYYMTETVRNYAMLAAQYGNDPKKGIDLLTKAVSQANARRDFIGQCKLQLGDYFILDGRIWDASLTYSQVDKAFREDALGEEARFRNARLAYYRGDFEWAQGQLSVLKASTSELIANDALYLSVLITENIPPDSNLVPLKRYAYADLLLFQNKDTEAETLLDSISKAFPDHPLKDDILMLHAKIAEKHGEYTKALEYLKDVYVKYGQDVLGDDAVFNTAEIYNKKLHQPALAKTFYETLITDYPGSTFVQSARKELQAMGQNP